MAKPKPESKVIEEPKKPYEMTPLEVEAAQRVNGRLKSRPPAPSQRSPGEPHVRQSSRGSERSSSTRRPGYTSALARRRSPIAWRTRGQRWPGNGGRTMSTLKAPDNATLPGPNVS
jgi:hypothetical protein